MRIESWNINSLRAHIGALEDHLRVHQPDILCLQETMVTDAKFPHDRIEAAGYWAATRGQKGKNGVALLTRCSARQAAPTTEVPLQPPSPPSLGVLSEARFLACRIDSIVIASVYVPYGRTPHAPQWQQKIEFFSALQGWVARRLSAGDAVLLCGDFNVAPTARDVSDESQFAGHAWTHADMRAALQRLCDTGLIDLGALHMPQGGSLTMWDERRFGKGTACGVRVDLLLGSPSIAARCDGAGIDASARLAQKTSDHVPVWCSLADVNGASRTTATSK